MSSSQQIIFDPDEAIEVIMPDHWCTRTGVFFRDTPELGEDVVLFIVQVVLQNGERHNFAMSSLTAANFGLQILETVKKAEHA